MNTVNSNQYLDLYNIIKVLYENKFKLLLSAIVGGIISFLIFDRNVQSFTEYVELNFSKKFDSEIPFDFQNELFYSILNRDNIKSTLLKDEITTLKEKDSINELILDIESRIDIEIRNKGNINVDIGVMVISLVHDESLSKTIDIKKFLKNVIINGQYLTLQKYINQLRSKIIDLEIELSDSNNILELEYNEKYLIAKADYERSLQSAISIKTYKREILVENIKIAESLSFENSQVKFSPSIDIGNDAGNEDLTRTIRQNLLSSKVTKDNTSTSIIKSTSSMPDIFSYAIDQGIPLYLFGYKILKSELEAINENRNFESDLKMNELENEVIYKNSLMEIIDETQSNPFIKKYQNELNILSNIKKENSFIINYNDIFFVQQKKISNSKFPKAFIGLIIFFIIASFVVLFIEEGKRRKIA